MARLIDADELIKNIDEAMKNLYTNTAALLAAKHFVEKAPTAFDVDVVMKTCIPLERWLVCQRQRC